MSNPVFRLCRLCSAALVIVWAGSMPANAGPRSTEAGLALEEITVTARKRPESLQRVPIAVSAISAEKLADAGIAKIQDLDAYVPSLVMSETAIGTNLALRGIFSGVNPGFEQSVGTYVDGIYRGRPQQIRMPFLDLERVEVLRGPQSILFGKNSVAGALNITTAPPTAELRRAFSALYNPEFDEEQYTGVLSGSLDERVRGRLAARYRQSAGYVENQAMSRSEPVREEWSARGTLEWDASDNLTLSLKAEQGEFDVVGRQIEIFEELPATSPPAPPAFTGLTYGQILAALVQDPIVISNVQDYERSANGDSSDNDTEEYVLTARWARGDYELTAISGYSAYAFSEACDCDFTGADVLRVSLAEDFRQLSQEIRLSGGSGGSVEYLAGLYFEKADLVYRDAIVIDPASVIVTLVDANPMLPPGSGTVGLANTLTPRRFEQQSEAYAAFVQATWNATDRMRLTGGLRYSHEDKTASRLLQIASASGGAPPDPALTNALYAALFNLRPHSLAGSRSEDRLLPSVTYEWDASDEVLAYASWSRGAKSGGFDARANNPPENGGSFEFEDEQADTFELGGKMRFGSAAELNAALFYTDFRDLQVSVFDGVLGFNVGNAAQARVQGLELDARWAATSRLTFGGALAYTDFEFKDYFGQCFIGQVPDAPDGINCSYAGKTNQFVAEWNAVVSAEYRQALERRFAWTIAADAIYSSEYNRAPTLDPHQLQDPYTLLNVRLAFGDRNGRWEVALVGRNLTDEVVMPLGNDVPLAARTFGAPSYAAFVNEPSSIAIEVRADF
jgi:outer membrane receptor protein involved in Fe transport